ncbi:MAG TPA: ATP-binding protein [Steroidobacteraceae bacterium]|nr:ATP-binding protein [Steroidobacteraceae bacterium]
MADKPKVRADDGTALIRISAALEAADSQRQDLATALAHERTLLRTMIDLIPAFIYAKDVGSRFIAMNTALARNMGTVASDAIGKTDFDFFAPELARKFYSDEQELLRSGTAIIDLEEPGFDAVTGMARTVCTSKVPLRDENGEVIGIIGVGFDITERKIAEQRLAASEHLESIGRLAAGVAHEINTPIQYLNDSVYFIRDAMQDLLAHNARLAAAMPVPPEADEDIEDIKRELPPALDRVVDGLARIAEIVRSMKEFSHVDQREMARIDLNRAINSTLVIARSEYKYVAEVQTDFQDLPLVTCHGGQVNQVVLNLVVNAAHAIADKNKAQGTSEKGLITVTTRIEDGFAVISIGDTGGGIPEAIRKRIFEPFFTTKEVGRGTGQGLSIAHNVIKSHGGQLDFVTEIGKGTTFHVRLPLGDAEQESAVARAGPIQVIREKPPPELLPPPPLPLPLPPFD